MATTFVSVQRPHLSTVRPTPTQQPQAPPQKPSTGSPNGATGRDPSVVRLASELEAAIGLIQQLATAVERLQAGQASHTAQLGGLHEDANRASLRLDRLEAKASGQDRKATLAVSKAAMAVEGLTMLAAKGGPGPGLTMAAGVTEVVEQDSLGRDIRWFVTPRGKKYRELMMANAAAFGEREVEARGPSSRITTNEQRVPKGKQYAVKAGCLYKVRSRAKGGQVTLERLVVAGVPATTETHKTLCKSPQVALLD